MAKRVNKNMIAGLTALAFVVMTGAGLTLVYQSRLSDPTELVSRAEEFAKAKDWNQAAVYYRRAYAASEDPVYLVRFADILRSGGNDYEALSQYQNVTIIDPKFLEALEKTLEIQIEIANLMPSARNWSEVKDTAESILALEEQDMHAHALFAKGTALFQLKELSPENADEGIRTLELAVQTSPNEFEFARSLAACYSALERTDDAEKLYSDLVARTTTEGPDAAEARCVWARQKLSTGNYDEAQALYADALKMAGSDTEVQALVHRKTGRFWMGVWREKKSGVRAGKQIEPGTPEELDEAFSRASDELQTAITLNPSDAESYITLASLQEMNDQFDAAIDTYQKRLDLPFPREGLQVFTSKRMRYNLLLGLADQYITKAGLAKPGTKAQDEFADKADEQIDEALTEAPNGMDAYYARGRLFLTLGRNKEAIHWFERAEELSRGLHWRNLHHLAVARLRDNQTGAAKEAITKAISHPYAPGACWVLYAKILLAENKPDEARIAAEQALLLSPGNRDAMLTRAAAQEKLGQVDVAIRTILGMEGESPEFMAGQAAYIAAHGDIDEGLARIESTLEKYPAHPRVVAIAANIYTKLDRKKDAMKVIDRALEQAPGEFELEVIKIRYSDLSKEERFQQLLGKIKNIQDKYDRAVRLAMYHGNQEDLEKQYEQFQIAKNLAKEKATEGARRAGESGLRSLIDAMFSIAIRTENTTQMDELIGEATQLNLDQADGLTYQGRRHLYDGFVANREARKALKESRGKDAETLFAEGRKHNEAAVEVLQEAIELYPTSGEAFAGLGDANRRLGEANEARIAYERAIDLTPQNGKVLKQLAVIADSLGNEEDYKNWLQKCREILPEDPWVVERTLVAQEEKNPREGIARREELLKEDPQNARNLHKLASLYTKLDDSEKAEQRIDQLLALPDGNRYLGTAASMLREIGKPEKALDILQKNLWNAPSEERGIAQLLIGDHYHAVRDKAAADTAYLAAADIDPSQSVYVAIGTYFTLTNRFTESDKWLQKALKKAEESTSPQKSRIQIMRIEVLTRSGNLDEAEALCDAYKTEYPDDPSSLYLASQIASNRGDVDSTIEKLTLYLEQRPDMHIASFNRAQALASVGEWQRAISDLEKLRATNPTAQGFKPRILLADAYDRVGRLDMAFQELEGVYKDHPEATNAIDRLISLYVAHDRYTDADSVLTTLLNNNPDHIGWLRRSAEIALLQNDSSKAIANLKHAVILGQFHPTLTAALLETFAKVDTPDQGIAFFEEQIPPGRRTPAVLLAYADLLGQRGDLRAAVDTFRTALHKSGFDSFDFLQQVARSVNAKFGTQQAIEIFRGPVDEVLAKSNAHILSALLQGSGQIDEALEICESLLETASSAQEKASIYLRIASGYASKDELDKAQKAYKQVLDLDENNLFALNNLAYLLSDELDRPAEALPYAKRAGKLSNLPAVLDTLGWVYYQLGQYRDAIAQFTRIRRAAPDFTATTYHLAESFRRAGDFEKAKTIFKEVIGDGQNASQNQFVTDAQKGLQLANDQNSD